MTKQILKIGNSVGLILPSKEVQKLKLKPGDKVEIFSDGNTLKIVPMRRIKAVALGGLCKGMDISEEDIAQARKEVWREPFR